MTVENNNLSGRSNEPEQIDLIDLVIQIWRGKVTIIICIIVAIALAVGYLAVAKENGPRQRLLLSLTQVSWRRIPMP